MAIQQPTSTDTLNNPDHAKSHRVFANDDSSPDKSLVADSSGNIGINKDSPGSRLHVNDDSTSGASNTLLTHEWLSPSSANNDEMRLAYKFKNSGGSSFEAARIGIEAASVTQSSENGRIHLYALDSGSFEKAITAAETYTVINEDGNDRDFRVESSGKANAFYVDGSTGYVGVNTNSVQNQGLDVLGQNGNGEGDGIYATRTTLLVRNNGSSSDDCLLAITSGTSGSCFIDFGDKNDTDNGYIEYDNSASKMHFFVGAQSSFTAAPGNKIGIGDTNPSYSVDIDGTGSSDIVRVQDSSGSTGVRYEDTGIFGHYVNKDLTIGATNEMLFKIYNEGNSTWETAGRFGASKKFAVGSGSPSAFLDVQGDVIVKRSSSGTDHTSSSEVIIGITDTTSARTVTLASAEANDGQVYIVKDESGAASSNGITIDTESSENIDGSASTSIGSDYGVVRVYSDGSNWFTF